MMKQPVTLSLDLLLLLLLVPAQILLNGEAASFLMVIPLFFYIGLELLHPLAAVAKLPPRFGRTRLFFLLRLFLLLLIIAGATAVPSLSNIYARLTTPVDATGYSPAYADVHDGAVQMELALAFLAEGKNPYVESYRDTPLQYYGFTGIDVPMNPAVDHFVYLPGFFVLSYPFYQVLTAVGLPYDQRWVYLLAYVGLVLLLPSLATAPSHKLALLTAVSLNPLLTWPVSIGMNDVAVLLPVLLSLRLLMRQRLLAAAIVFGLACTLKQSAWFMAPFFLLLLYRQRREMGVGEKLPFLLYPLLLAVVMLLIVGPFAVWDSAAFITDVWQYPAGNVALNYPIRGYTVGNLLVGSGVISSSLDPFPFWLLQATLGLPLLGLLLRYQWHHSSSGTMLLAAGLFILGMGLLSRFFQDNYVGFVAVLISAGILLNSDHHASSRNAAMRT